MPRNKDSSLVGEKGIWSVLRNIIGVIEWVQLSKAETVRCYCVFLSIFTFFLFPIIGKARNSEDKLESLFYHCNLEQEDKSPCTCFEGHRRQCVWKFYINWKRPNMLIVFIYTFFMECDFLP